MGQNFQDSQRYASLHQSSNGPGDARPTTQQILEDNDMIGQLQGRVVLITGGSNGLGVEEVRSLAKTGAQIFFTSRNLDKGRKVRDEILKELGEVESGDGPRVEVIQMDLQSLDSVRKGAEEFKTKSEKLDLLINNAGIAMTPHVVTKDGHEQQFQVNHLAHFYLFELLKALLLDSSTPSFHSRVVAVSSLVHTMGSVFLGDYNMENVEGGYNPAMAYAQSKTANIWMANEIERRYGSKGLHGLSVHPGGIATGLSDSHDEASAKMVEEYVKMPHIARQMKSVEQGAASIVLAAIGKEYEGVGGYYMEDCGKSLPLADDAAMGMPGYKPWAYDQEGARRLWADSLKMVGLEED